MKKFSLVAAFAVLFSTATFGASGTELPNLPAVKGDRLLRSVALSEPSPARFGELAADAMLTNSVTAPSGAKFVREPRGLPGFLGGLPVMKIGFSPPQYLVFPPIGAACFGFADPQGMACVGRAVVTVLRAPSPYGCIGFGTPDLVCAPEVFLR